MLTVGDIQVVTVAALDGLAVGTSAARSRYPLILFEVIADHRSSIFPHLCMRVQAR